MITHKSARALHLILLLALLPAAPARADAPVELPPIEVNQDARLPSWRMDYAHRISGTTAHDDYLDLMATRDLYALLYEHARTSPIGPQGIYGVDRLAFLYGGPSRPDRGDSDCPDMPEPCNSGGYIGLGQTWVRGPRLQSEVSLLVRYQLQAAPGIGPELALSLPLTNLSGGGQPNASRETDAEFAWRFQVNRYFNFRYAYRRYKVDTNFTGGWYLSFGLVY